MCCPFGLIGSRPRLRALVGIGGGSGAHWGSRCVLWPRISGSGGRARLSPSAITGSKRTLPRGPSAIPPRTVPRNTIRHCEVKEIAIFSGVIELRRGL